MHSFDTATARATAAPEASAGRQAELDFAVIDTIAGFEAIAPEWNTLVSEHGRPHHVFQQHAWLKHWADHFFDASRQQLAILTGRRDGRLVMIWPLVREKVLGFQIARWMGAPVSQYKDIIADDAATSVSDYKAALAFLRRDVGCDVLFANNIRADASIAPALADAGARKVRTNAAAVLDLSGIDTFAQLEERWGGLQRRKRKRRRKLLAGYGAPRFEVIAPGEKAETAVAAALCMKRAWLERHAIVSNAYSQPAFEDFWRSIAASGDKDVGLRTAVLSVDEAPVAVEVGLTFKGVHFAHIGAFDSDLDRCSPGLTQMEDMIALCVDEGLEAYDLLPPQADYKARVSDREVAVADYVLPLSMGGRLCDAMRVTDSEQIAKAAVSRMPTAARAALKQVIGYVRQTRLGSTGA